MILKPRGEGIMYTCSKCKHTWEYRGFSEYFIMCAYCRCINRLYLGQLFSADEFRKLKFDEVRNS